MIAETLLVLLVVAALRASPRLIHDPALLSGRFPLAGDQSDSMSHLIMADMVRRNGGRIPRRTDRFLLGRELDYPMFFHQIASLLPRRWLERWEWIVSAMVEGLHAGVMVVFAAVVIERFGLAGNPAAAAALVVLAVAATPVLTAFVRRAMFFGERAFGFLFANVFIMATAAFVLGAGWPAAAVAAAAFTVTAASSKFGVQAMAAIAGGMSLLLLDPAPLLVLAASAAASAPLSGGYAWRTLRGLWRHAMLYRRHLVHLSDATRGFSASDLAAGIRLLVSGDPAGAAARLARHPIARIPWDLPWVAPFAVLLWARLADPGALDPAAVPLADVLLAWGAAALLAGIATMTDSLKFLGEGRRYLEFAALPMALGVLLLPSSLGGTAWLAVGALGLAGLLHEIRRRPDRLLLPSAGARDLAARVADLPPARLFALPGRLTLPLCYGTGHQAVWHIAHIDGGVVFERWFGLFRGGAPYSFAHPDAVRELAQAGEIDLLAVWKPGLPLLAETKGFRYALDGFRVVYENPEFALYDLRPPGGDQDAGTGDEPAGGR